MEPHPRTRRRAALSLALVALLALTAAGLASAASTSIHVKITKKTIKITGSASATGLIKPGGLKPGENVVEVYFDTSKCAGSYTAEHKRANGKGINSFTDLRPKKAGPFTFKLSRSVYGVGKPRAHYVCAYLLTFRTDFSIKVLRSASAKLS